MHRSTLGPDDWVGIMENISHGEETEAKEEMQFGMPVRMSCSEKVLLKLGFAKYHRRVDLRYINSMRPSRHIFEKEPEPPATPADRSEK